MLFLLSRGRGASRRRLLRPGAILVPSRYGLTRSQASGAKRGVLGSDGSTWTEQGANTASQWGAAQWLAQFGQVTNNVANPRCEGASAPSTWPTGWLLDGNSTGANGISVAVAGVGRDSGIDYLAVDFSGTATATTGRAINFVSSTALAAAANDIRREAAFIRVAPGYSLGSLNLWLRIMATNGTSVDHTGLSVTPTDEWQRFSVSRTMPASTTNSQPRLRYGAAVGNVVSTRLWIGWPNEYLSPLLPPPCLPAAGTPAAATVGSDLISATMLSDRVTLLSSVSIPQAAPSGVTQAIVGCDDGTENSYVRVQNSAGGSTIVVVARSGGGSVTTTTLGTMTAGTAFAVGLSVDRTTGAYQAVMAGGSVQSGTGPTTLTTQRWGNSSDGTASLSGYRIYDDEMSGYPSASALAALVNAMPLS